MGMTAFSSGSDAHEAAASFRQVPFIPRDIEVERRAEGVLVVRHRHPLKEYAQHIPALLRQHAAERPDRVWLAQRRGPNGDWATLCYRQARLQVDGLTQGLLDLDLPGRTIMALSGNSMELGVLTLAAMQARMPIAVVTPAYSLRGDFSKLREMAARLDPAVLFVQNAAMFEPALHAIGLEGRHVIYVDDAVAVPRGHAYRDLVKTSVRSDVDNSVSMIKGETVAKYLFTSGSTGHPKAVITTQRMMCAAVAMHEQVLAHQDASRELVVLDWMPWSHVAAGNAQFNGVLAAGGTFYIDEGNPTPALFAETIRNLREVAPTRFGNVPVGYAMLMDALERDESLAANFFSRLDLLIYAGARLPDELYERFQRLAVQFTGFRIPFVSAYGATETAPCVTHVYWPTDRVGLIGLPHPGVDLKLVPLDGERFEVRARSIAVMPGYLGEPELTSAAFDDEGFYRLGDAASFVDRSDPREGFLFAGRVSEDFKLMSGVFVNAGQMRSAALELAAPLLAEAVVVGPDRPWLGLLAWPNIAACRALLKDDKADISQIVKSELIRGRLAEMFSKHNRSEAGSSRRIARLLLLSEPPSFDANEITAKGSINQKAVLTNRSGEVARLFSADPDDDVILCK